jgi:hypothetical protein
VLRHLVGRIAPDRYPISLDFVDELRPQPLKLIGVQGRSTLVGGGAVHIAIVIIRLNFRNGSGAGIAVAPET